MSFFSRIQPLFSDEDAKVSGQLISYTIIEGSEEDELVLLRSENPEFTDETEEREADEQITGLPGFSESEFLEAIIKAAEERLTDVDERKRNDK